MYLFFNKCLNLLERDSLAAILLVGIAAEAGDKLNLVLFPTLLKEMCTRWGKFRVNLSENNDDWFIVFFKPLAGLDKWKHRTGIGCALFLADETKWEEIIMNR